MYLTYKEYLEYGGELDESTFNQVSFTCSKMIDAMTAMRVSNMKVVPEAVKRCIFELISQEMIYHENLRSITLSPNGGKIVSSFSTDGYQESYGGASENSGLYMDNLRKGIDELHKQTIKDMLAYERDDNNVKLLYRGVV